MNYIGPTVVNTNPSVVPSRHSNKGAILNTRHETQFKLPAQKPKKPDIAKPDIAKIEPTHNNLLHLTGSHQENKVGQKSHLDISIDEDGFLIEEPETHLFAQDIPTITTAQQHLYMVELEPDHDKNTLMTKLNALYTAKDMNMDSQLHNGVTNIGVFTDKMNMSKREHIILNSAQKDQMTPPSSLSDTKQQNMTPVAEKTIYQPSKNSAPLYNDKQSYISSLSMADKPGINTDRVEVLQMRHFPAISHQMTNAHNVAQAILKSEQLSNPAAIQNIDPIYNISRPKALNTIKIQLYPVELGMVTANMKLSGKDLQIQLHVDNIEAFRRLNEDSSSIIKALRGQGFGIEQINIQLINDRGTGQQGNPQNNQLFQSYTNSEQMKNQSGSSHHPPHSDQQDAPLITTKNDLTDQSHLPVMTDSVYL